MLDKLLKHFARERYQSAAEVINDLHSPVFSPPSTIIAPPQPVQPSHTSVNVSTPQQPVGNLSQKSTPHQKKSGLSLKTFSFETVTVDAWGNIVNFRNLEAKYFIEELGNGVTLEMVEIPGGTFMMGSPEGEEGGYDDESPQHQITVPSFYMCKFVVTQEQYQAIMGKNPSHFKGKKRPVEQVSWNDAITFCQRLSLKTRRIYRLPSEAEWEYACRAGTTTPFYFGETITPDLVNYDGNYPYASAPKGEYRKQTTDVGTFPPNRFGLYDMHGNVFHILHQSINTEFFCYQ